MEKELKCRAGVKIFWDEKQHELVNEKRMKVLFQHYTDWCQVHEWPIHNEYKFRTLLRKLQLRIPMKKHS